MKQSNSNSFIEKLKKEGDIDGLVKALSHQDEDVRRKATSALGKIGDARTVKPLIEALEDKEWTVRMDAAYALGRIGDSRAVEPLIEALKIEEWNLQNAAAYALGKIGDARAAQPLIEALDTEDAALIYEKVRKALTQIGKPATEPLVEALKHDNEHVRSNAAFLLGKARDERALETLIHILGDENTYDWVERHDAAIALGELRDEKAFEALAYTVLNKNEYWEVRVQAIIALGKIKDKRAEEPLVKALKHKYYQIRVAAATSLAKVGGERAVKPLIKASKDIDVEVGDAAFSALEKIRKRIKKIDVSDISTQKDASYNKFAIYFFQKDPGPFMIEEFTEMLWRKGEKLGDLKSEDLLDVHTYIAAKMIVGSVPKPEQLEKILAAFSKEFPSSMPFRPDKDRLSCSLYKIGKETKSVYHGLICIAVMEKNI